MKAKRLVFVSCFVFLVFLVACAPPPTEVTPTPSSELTPVPASVPTPSPPPVGFFLKVAEPKDEGIVTSRVIPVSGVTSADAIVSVNGEAAEVDERGNFSTMVTLEEGPNIIEVIASDYAGNKESVILAVIYIP